MKIIIYTDNKEGGVRNVTQNLAAGLRSNGHDTYEAETFGEVIRLAIAHPRSAAVLSLSTGVLSFLFSRKVYILHGFATVDTHSWLKSFGLRLIARLAAIFGARLVAVSYLTRAVYERFMGIKVQDVIFNGCSNDFILLNQNPQPYPKEKTVVFIGRLIAGKRVLEAIQGFLISELSHKGYRMQVVGSGPLEQTIKKLYQNNPNIEILGGISDAQKLEVIARSEIFVSLNDFEPMGVVFVEAMMANCKIVAPFCGGHREFIPQGYSLATCDPHMPASIAKAFNSLESTGAFSGEFRSEIFNYTKSIAPRYLENLFPPA